MVTSDVKDWLALDVVMKDRYILDWCKWTPSKCNIFLWRAELNRIPTKVALRQRNINIDSTHCIFCEDMDETTDRLFTGCAFSNGVWQGISEWCNVPSIYAFKIQDLLELHKQIPGSDIKRNIFKGVIIVTCWRIWKARNEKLFANKICNVVEVVSDVKAYGFLWYRNRYKSDTIDWRKWCNFEFM
ncbi:putative reverse transcriptase zinc-binding domain-containing protein [Helianthus annuus]|nr:putative reverse transcriptase zinc-binding domain-containing protein [Helianthus annuus]KAJ0889184.1 putative reverse transcriptase zinc-binding domain-containing protein [Helianthus annuus]